MNHNNCSHPFERDFSLLEAQRRILLEFDVLKLNYTTHTIGDKVMTTCVAVQNTHFPERLSSGVGKGYKEGALVGGLYEALEHYLTIWHGMQFGVHYENTSYFYNEGYFFDDSVLDFVRQQNSAIIACRRYVCPVSQEVFSYPIALALPDYVNAPLPGDTFDYAGMRRYCANSGTAIGANFYEAALHAANECIERDALSLFLLTHFYYQCDISLKTLDRSLVTSHIACLWQEVEEELNAEVLVVDISTEFKVKTYLAFAKTSYSHAHLFGSGASWDAGHAVQRALTELVQLHVNAYNQTGVVEELLCAERHLMSFPRLRRCMRFDIVYLLEKTRHEFVTLPVSQPVPTLAEQVCLLAQNMRLNNRILGISTVYVTEQDTTLVNVVIPGLERFYIVGSGNVVVPQIRGRQLGSVNV